MADCGTSGTALDRATSRLISSMMGNNSAHVDAAASRAGKAIGSFIGEVASNTLIAGPLGGTLNTARLMPVAPPSYLPVQSGSNNQATIHHSNGFHHSTSIMESNHSLNHNNKIMQRPTMPLSYPSINIHPHEAMQIQQRQYQQNHVNMMQMQMMNQQIAMMQTQLSQQQQYQLKMKSMQTSTLNSKSDTSDLLQQDDVNLNSHEQYQSNHNGLNTELGDTEWHDRLEEEFQSYLQQSGLDNAASTAEDNTDLGHEGHAQGASIDQLAAAWAEAEKEYGIESSQLYDDNEIYESANDLHYEFQETSKLYQPPPSSSTYNQNINKMEKFDLMSEGMRHFQEGNTTDAIKCFESELIHNDPDNSDAWLMLGKCHAENDEDRKAIACLERAVERDPYCTDALLTLAVSYVNELDHTRALHHLKNWVTHNPKYAGLELPMDDGTYEKLELAALEELKQILQCAQEFDTKHGHEENIPEILEALGVVYNVSREYDSAVEAFRSAIKVRPDNYQLWNKLGATLANSNRSEEALPAYHQALSLKPKYARSWLNLAISHSNLQNHDESARCYLQTLSLNPSALHVWSYLRIALTCSERWELLPLAAEQNLDAFKSYYDFVLY